MNSQKRPQAEHDVARLLALAGEPDPIPAEREARVRATVENRWQAQVSARRRRLPGVALAVAASLVLAAGLTRWLNPTSPVAPPVPLATVERLAGEVLVLRAGVANPLTAGAALQAGDELRSGSGRLALRWASGHSVRLNVATTLEVTEASSLRLRGGEVYVDGPGAGQLRIDTPAGPVRDIGTQFLLELTRESVQIRVREGVVELSPTGFAPTAVDEGYGLVYEFARNEPPAPVKQPLRPDEQPWEWATELAPLAPMQGREVDEFLRWLAREQGWRLSYADAAARRTARREKVSGRLDPDGTAEQWLSNTLRSVELDYELRGSTLVIRQR